MKSYVASSAISPVINSKISNAKIRKANEHDEKVHLKCAREPKPKHLSMINFLEFTFETLLQFAKL